jgi:N6-adenosine-specific RNA methylase IME4
VSNAAVLADAPPGEQREIVARGEREIKAAAKAIKAREMEERRAARLAKLAEVQHPGKALQNHPGGPWPVVLADPPWKYQIGSPDGSRAIERHYQTMELADICALPVPPLATASAVLFLWAPPSKLEDAQEVIRAWGFTHKSAAVWVKDRIGLGLYFRNRAEVLCVATRGDMPAPAPSDRPDGVIEAAACEHSRKPDEVYALIERMYPGLPKVELFARRRWPGWAVWGNEAPDEDAP